MSDAHANLDPARRGRLAQKGRRLYARACAASDPNACAEAFVRHHLAHGETDVARDFLHFLDAQLLLLLQQTDPDQARLARTEELVTRVRTLLAHAELAWDRGCDEL